MITNVYVNLMIGYVNQPIINVYVLIILLKMININFVNQTYINRFVCVDIFKKKKIHAKHFYMNVYAI